MIDAVKYKIQKLLRTNVGKEVTTNRGKIPSWPLIVAMEPDYIELTLYPSIRDIIFQKENG